MDSEESSDAVFYVQSHFPLILQSANGFINIGHILSKKERIVHVGDANDLVRDKEAGVDFHSLFESDGFEVLLEMVPS